MVSGVDHDEPSTNTSRWVSTGSFHDESPYFARLPRYSADTEGGVLSAFWWSNFNDTQGPDLWLWRTDEQGAVRSGFPTTLDSLPLCQLVKDAVAFGRDTQGDVHVLWQGDARFGPGTTAGQWLDARGMPQTNVFEANVPLSQGAQLSPLADGRLALRLQGEWAYVFRPQATAAEPTPCWLQRRPDTDVSVIAGGRANAFVPMRGKPSPCDRALEVVTSDGQSCGALPLDDPGMSCDSTNISIGVDGTVLRQRPEVAPTDGGTTNLCPERWWPGLLR